MEEVKNADFMQVVDGNLDDIVKDAELVDNPMDKEITEDEIKDGHIERTAKFQQIWHQSHTPWMRINQKISRNAPCPCGSGKKYKNCCLLRDEGREIYRLKDDPTYK
jgi:preprotein translocase subunit SecA